MGMPKEMYASFQHNNSRRWVTNNDARGIQLQLASRLQDQITEGKQLLEQKKYMEALHVFADVMSTVDSSLLVMILKAYCFLGLKQHDQASKLASTVLRQDPENTEAMYIRGKALYYGGNFEHAVSHYSQALRLDPDFSKARDELRKVRLLERKKKDGNDAFTRGDYEEAVNAYTEALAIDPDNVQFNSQLFANRAAARGKLRLFEEAISDCTRAIDLDNGYVKAYMRRANLYSQVERYEDAVRDYEAAKKLDPENRDIREGLRQAKVDLKRSKRKDYYKILCLPKDATEAQIKKAYRKLALQWHPDKHSHSVEAARKAEEMFKDVTEAYSVLSDPKKRQRYDMGADLEDLDGPGGFGGEGVDVNEIFSMFFGGPGGPGGMHGMPGGFQSSFRPRQHHHYHGGRGGYGGGGYDSFFG